MQLWKMDVDPRQLVIHCQVQIVVWRFSQLRRRCWDGMFTAAPLRMEGEVTLPPARRPSERGQRLLWRNIKTENDAFRTRARLSRPWKEFPGWEKMLEKETEADMYFLLPLPASSCELAEGGVQRRRRRPRGWNTANDLDLINVQPIKLFPCFCHGFLL